MCKCKIRKIIFVCLISLFLSGCLKCRVKTWMIAGGYLQQQNNKQDNQGKAIIMGAVMGAMIKRAPHSAAEMLIIPNLLSPQSFPTTLFHYREVEDTGLTSSNASCLYFLAPKYLYLTSGHKLLVRIFCTSQLFIL